MPRHFAKRKSPRPLFIIEFLTTANIDGLDTLTSASSLSYLICALLLHMSAIFFRQTHHHLQWLYEQLHYRSPGWAHIAISH